MTLVEFLRARLDEDEHDGRRLATTRHGASIVGVGDGDPIVISGARLLAEVEAKRRIVEERPLPIGHSWDLVRAWHDTTLRLLALPYADHDAYDESWRP